MRILARVREHHPDVTLTIVGTWDGTPAATPLDDLARAVPRRVDRVSPRREPR